jgi:hypothetical protein
MEWQYKPSEWRQKGTHMNAWHDINPKRMTPGNFLAVIEIPKGSSGTRRYQHRQGARPRRSNIGH